MSIDFFIQNTVYDPLNRIPLCKCHICIYGLWAKKHVRLMFLIFGKEHVG